LSFGAGAGGEIRYTVVVDARTAGQQLQSVSQQMQTLGTNTQTTTSQIEEMPRALDQVKQKSDQVRQSQVSLGSAIQSAGTAIAFTVSSVISLVVQYTQLQRAQNMLERAKNIEKGQTITITDLQTKYNKAVKKYGEHSKEAEQALKKLQLAQQKHSTQVEKIGLMQDTLNERMLSFATTIVPTVIGVVSGLTQTIQILHQGIGGTGGIKGLTLGLGKVFLPLAALGVALFAVKTNMFGFRDIVNGVGSAIGKAVPALKPFLNAIKDVGVVFGIIPGDAEKAKKSLEGFGQGVITWGKSVLDEISKIVHKLGSGDITGAIADIKKDIMVTIGSIKIRGFSIDQIWTGLKVIFQHRLKEKGPIPAVLGLLADIGEYALNPSQNTKDIFKGIGDLYTKEAKQNPVTASINLFTRVVDFTIAKLLPSDYAKAYLKFANEWDKSKGTSAARVAMNVIVDVFPTFDFTKFKTEATKPLTNELTGAKGKSLLEMMGFPGSIQLAELFRNNLPDIGAILEKWRKPVLAKAKETGVAIVGAIGLGIQSINDFGKFLSNWLSTSIDLKSIIKEVMNIGKLIVGGIGLGIQSIKDFGTFIGNYISDQGMQALKGAQELGMKIGDSIIKGVKAIPDAFKALGTYIWNLIFSGIQSNLDKYNKNNPVPGGRVIPSYFDSQNEQALLGRAPTTREELYALLNAFGIHGSTGPNTGLPQAGARIMPISTSTNANPMDIQARQAVQLTKDYNTLARTIVTVTKDYNTLARATVTTTKDNNTLARTIVTTTKDNNTYAKTIVTVTKDINQWARATVTQTKDNNQLAKTVVTTTKDNNQFAKTIVQITKDLNQVARAISQTTKNLNQMARAMVQSTKDAKQLASAIRSIPSGGGFGFAKGGIISAASGYIEESSGPTTVTFGDNPGGREVHAFIPRDNPYPTLDRVYNMFGMKKGRAGEHAGPIILNLTYRVDGNDIVNTRQLHKQIRLEPGSNRDRFG